MTRFTLLGTGMMGTAVGGCLLDHGHEVHVWNRTGGKIQPLVERGAVAHLDADAALENGDALVLMLSGHTVATEILRKSTARLRGKDILDLMTGSPRNVRQLASLAEAADAYYLDATIECFPGEIGTDEALIYVCGDESAWNRRGDALRALSPATHFVGTRIGTAGEIDAALAGAFGTVAMSAWMEALALLSDVGIDLKSSAINIGWWIRHLEADMIEALEEVRTGDFATTEATLSVNAAALVEWRQAFVDRGHRAEILTAALHTMEAAVDAGLGDRSWSAQIDVMRNPG